MIAKTCIECKVLHEIHVSEEGLRRWESGELIQRAMPSVSEADRELLISGICGKCFDELFAEDSGEGGDWDL